MIRHPGSRTIYIDVPEDESRGFTGEYEKLGYQVVHVNDTWFKAHTDSIVRSAMKGMVDVRPNPTAKKLAENSGCLINPARSVVKRHDKGGMWYPWQVAICQNPDDVARMEKMDVPVIGYEHAGGERLACPYIVQSLEAVDEEDMEQAFCRHYNLPITILKTPRTIVREFTMSDLDDLIAMYNEPHITDFTDALYPKEEERAYEQAYIDNGYRFYGYGMWVVIHKADGALMGRAGVESSEICGAGEVELGYIISTRYQHQGYATEVCTAIVDHAFKKLQMQRIMARVNPNNVPSVKLLNRLGFQKIQLDRNGKMLVVVDRQGYRVPQRRAPYARDLGAYINPDEDLYEKKRPQKDKTTEQQDKE